MSSESKEKFKVNIESLAGNKIAIVSCYFLKSMKLHPRFIEDFVEFNKDALEALYLKHKNDEDTLIDFQDLIERFIENK